MTDKDDISPATETPDNETPDNETMREVKRAKARKQAASKDTGKESSGIGWKTAAGIGIGSAALAAALIYASKGRKKDG